MLAHQVVVGLSVWMCLQRKKNPKAAFCFHFLLEKWMGRLAEGTGLAPAKCMNTFLQKGIRLPKACLKWVPPASPAAGSLSTHPACPGGWITLGAELKLRFSPFQVLWDPGWGCGLVGAGWDPCPPPVQAQLRKGSSLSSTLSALFLFWVNQLQTKMMCRKWMRPLEPGITMAWAVSPGYLLCIVYHNCAREKELFFSKWLLDTSCAAYQQPDLDPEMSVPAQSRQGSIIRDALATYFSTDGDNV